MRYHRNILVEGIGEEGQARLWASKVLVIGAGGLGSPVLFYLAAAGVGTIGIVDDDIVNISNLQRQILHATPDIGTLKTISAQKKLNDLNPEVKIVLYHCRFHAENAEQIISGRLKGVVVNATLGSYPQGEYDFVVDCCDNYSTKLLINDVCLRLKKPYSHGAVVDMRGEAMTYIPDTACYRCLYDALPEDNPTAPTGIMGSVAGITGCIQATETIKYLTGRCDLLTDRLLIIDANTMKFTPMKVRKSNSCICQSYRKA